MTGHFKADAIARRAAHQNLKRSTPNASCYTGGFYISPKTGATLDSADPVAISWDTSCLNATGVDIYIMAPSAPKPLLHWYKNVNFANGGYNVTIDSSLWNGTASETLQLTIVDTGDSPALSLYPAGPVFTMKTTSTNSSHTTTGAVTGAVTEVNNFSLKKLAPGKTAAAVIMPLLIVALGIAAYIRWSRSKGLEKRKRFNVAVDKRMSTISTDWKSTTAAGAAAAIRNSMAIPGNRNSSFSFGNIRASTADETFDYTQPAMSQRRPGVTAATMADRNSRGVSKVSFAEGTRPSRDGGRGASRAFHSAYIPPVPTLKRNDSENGRVSPTQAEGPASLTTEDIEARLSGHEYDDGKEADDIMPALNMMRHGGGGLYSPEDSEFLFDAPATPKATGFPQPPTPTHQSPIQRKQSQDASPVGMMPMQPMPANVMSPDDMLRAYAERRATQASTGSSNAASSITLNNNITYPVPPANTHYNGNGMRTLYSPTSPTTAGSAQPFALPQEDYRQSTTSEYSGEFHGSYAE